MRTELGLEDVLPNVRRISLTMEGQTDDGATVTVTFPRIDFSPDPAWNHGAKLDLDRDTPSPSWLEEMRLAGPGPWNVDLSVRGVLDRFGEPGAQPAFTITHHRSPSPDCPVCQTGGGCHCGEGESHGHQA